MLERGQPQPHPVGETRAQARQVLILMVRESKLRLLSHQDAQVHFLVGTWPAPTDLRATLTRTLRSK